MGTFLAVRATGPGVAHINEIRAVCRSVVAAGCHAAHPSGSSVGACDGHARTTAAALRRARRRWRRCASVPSISAEVGRGLLIAVSSSLSSASMFCSVRPSG